MADHLHDSGDFIGSGNALIKAPSFMARLETIF